jgi:transposase
LLAGGFSRQPCLAARLQLDQVHPLAAPVLAQRQRRRDRDRGAGLVLRGGVSPGRLSGGALLLLDVLADTALALVRDSQAVYCEDIAVHGLARTRLARSVHDAGWSQLLRLVEEKAAFHGRYFARIGRFVPTSQICSACGVKDGPKPLAVREWTCAACGTTHDRDVNAARNILAAGRADRLNASGGSVRPPATVAAASERGTHRGAA